jgi:ribosomal protein L11 methyltransferase
VRKSFKPIVIANDFWVAPTWTDVKNIPKGKVISIDPGEAFGTGSHPTTRQAGQLLLDVISIKDSPSVLDVGTGSGILAILAKKAGAGRVLAIDNDPRAIEVAMDNFRLNNCYIEVSHLPLAELKDKFDIVVANILLETLLDMASHLKRLTKKGGNIILAGLLVEQGGDMRYRMMEIGLNAPEKELIEDGWLAMRFKV